MEGREKEKDIFAIVFISENWGKELQGFKDQPFRV